MTSSVGWNTTNICGFIIELGEIEMLLEMAANPLATAALAFIFALVVFL